MLIKIPYNLHIFLKTIKFFFVIVTFMRYFLIFFCFLFQFCMPFAHANEPVLTSNIPVFDEDTIIEQGIFTGRKGLGEYQKTEFGRFRLISCSGGIPKDNALFLMVEGLLFDGWVLQKPVIPYSVDEKILQEDISYPIADLNEKHFSGYKNEAYFSLVYFLKEGVTEFNLNKKIPVKACKDNICKEDLLDLSLILKNDSKYPTDICAKMHRKFQLIARKPQKKEIEAVLNIIDNNHVQLIASFNQNVSFLNFQTENLEDFEIIKKDFNENQASLLIKTNTKKMPQSLLVTLISSAGIFETNIEAKEAPYMFLKENLNWFYVFCSGIWLFFLSPLFYLFLSLPDKEAELLQRVRKIKIIYGLLFLTLAILFYFMPQLANLLEISGPLIVVSFLTLCWLLYKPMFGLGMGVLFFVLLPKPYMTEAVLTFSSIKGYIFILFLIWYVISMFPFEALKKYPALFGALRNLKQYPILIRLPQIILFFWLIISFSANFSVKVEPETINTLRKTNQPMYISVERGLCLSCYLNKLSLAYYLKHFTDYDKNKFLILTLDATKENSKEFLKKNKFALKTQGLFFGLNQIYPERIKGFIPIEEWHPFFYKVTPKEKENVPSIYSEE